MRWALPFVQAVSALLLAALVRGAACTKAVKLDDFPDSVHFRIGESLVQHASKDRLDDGLDLKSYLQSYGRAMVTMRAINPRVGRLLSNELSAVRWLSKGRCELEPISDDSPPHRGIYDFWYCVKECLRVKLDWSFDSVTILQSLLRARVPWKDSPATLSVSRDSWSFLEAVNLATLLEADGPALPSCSSVPLHRWLKIFQWLKTFAVADAKRVEDAIAAMNQKAFGIERLHLAVDDEKPQDVSAGQGMIRDPKLRFLSNASFVALTGALVNSSHLRDLSISWDARRTTNETARLAEAIATALARRTSLRRLALLRTCYDGEHSQDGDPLAAFSNAAAAGKHWNSVETLVVMTHRCRNDEDLDWSSVHVVALRSLAERMPALRRVHLEYQDKQRRAHWLPDVGEIKWLVPDHVTVTITTSWNGFADIASADTLAPLRGASSDGYAVVMPVRYTFKMGVIPTCSFALVDRSVLLATTALAIVFSFNDKKMDESLEQLATLVPNLERLAIDSRSAAIDCNGIVQGLLPVIGTKLRALLVHTMVLRGDRRQCRAFERLQQLLQTGRDISVIDLGIAVPKNYNDAAARADAGRLESLAATLSGMPHLEALSLTLTVPPTRGNDSIDALRAVFVEGLPFARVTVVKDVALHFTHSQVKYDRRRLFRCNFEAGQPPPWRRPRLIKAVPPTSVFPSPQQFVDEL